MRWLQRRLQQRKWELDGKILRLAFEKTVRTNHPTYTDAEVAVVVDEMMQLHNMLEDGYVL